MKPEVRIIAWDDCRHTFNQKNVRLVGIVYRGASFMDGMLSCTIKKDGTDATEKITDAMLSSSHYGQLSYIMLDGITFGGLNVVDIKMLNKKTKLPVIVVVRKQPDMEKFYAALKKLKESNKRIAATKAAGKVKRCGNVFYQKHGTTHKEACELLRLATLHGNLPEPLRVAHIIASGLGR